MSGGRTPVVVGYGMVRHRLVEELRARDAEGAWRIVVLAEEHRPASYLDDATAEDLAAGRGVPHR